MPTLRSSALVAGAVAAVTALAPAGAAADPVNKPGWTTLSQTLYAGVTTAYETAVDPQRNRVFVTDSATTSPQVAMVNGANHAFARSLSFRNLTPVPGVDRDGNPTTLPVRPFGLAVDPVHRKVITSNTTSNTATVFDEDATEVTDADVLKVGQHPFSLAVDTKKGRAYIANGVDDTLSVVNLLTEKVDRTIPGGEFPTKLAIDEAARRIYVGSATARQITVIDADSQEIVDTIPVGANSRPAVDPVARKLYAGNYGDKTVTVVDTTTNRAIKTIPTGGPPNTVAVDPGRHLVYTADLTGNVVTVIDSTKDEVVQVVPVGPRALGMAVNLETGWAYTSSMGNGTLTALQVTRPRAPAPTSAPAPVPAEPSQPSGRATATPRLGTIHFASGRLIVDVSGAGDIAVAARERKRTMAKATGSARRAGTVRLRLRATKAGRAAQRRRAVKAAATVTFAPRGDASTRVRRTLRVTLPRR